MSDYAQDRDHAAGSAGGPAMLDAALAYAAQGVPVFPCWGTNGQGECECPKKHCDKPGKHPRTQHGFKNATTNPFQIRQWWRKWPQAPIGIRTGAVLVGLDADDGEDGLAEAIEYGVDPSRLHDRTGNGRHFVYRAPEGVVLRNKGKGVGGWPFQHCDARGEGGYLVAAPSLHYSGRRYAWSEPFNLAAVPAVPDQLLAVWRDPEDDPRNAVPLPDDAHDGHDDEDDAEGNGGGLGEVSAAYFLDRYTWLVVEGTADRNNAGFALACQLRDAPLPQTAAVPYLQRYQHAVEHARAGKAPYTWAEAEQSLKQAYTRPARTPVLLSEQGHATWAAQRYRAAYGDRLRYDHVNRRWLVWDGRYWEPNVVGEAGRLGQELVSTLYNEARKLPGEQRKTALGRVLRLDTATNIRGMVQLASEWEPLRAQPTTFDRDPWLATVANGTLDLRLAHAQAGGTVALLREHRQADMLTRHFGKHRLLAYNPEAPCPNWDAFLRRVFVHTDGTPDHDLIAYLQRWFGYTLTGIVTEQMLLLCHGGGQNGKRTFVQAIEEILGAYAETISIETLLAQRFEGNAGPAELAKLDGARFVQCGENDAGRSLNEARIKLLTGNDPVPARRLRGDPFSFDPQFKLLLHTNHKPKIRGRDKGIWRRVKLVPFTVTIPEGERDPLYFDHCLRGELDGILAWAVRGCLAWQRGGLGEPATVTAATSEYRDAEDIVRQFAVDYVYVATSATDQQKALHGMFLAWCAEQGIRQKLSSQTFAERLCDVTGCTRKRGEHGQEFVGLRLRKAGDPWPAPGEKGASGVEQ